MMNIDSNASTQAPPALRYGTSAIDFGSKYTSNIKDAYRNDEPWAVAMIEAERAPIVRPKYLSARGFAKNTLYGVMHGGLRVPTKFTSPDPSVRETLSQWARNLNHDFGALKSYTPNQLAQRVSDLYAVIAVLKDGLGDLVRSAEIGTDDMTAWQRTVEGLESYADAADKLRTVLADGPGIDMVHMDVDPKRH